MGFRFGRRAPATSIEERSLPELLAKLDSGNSWQRAAARQRIEAMGVEVIPHLAKVLEKGGSSARLEAIKALVEIGTPAVIPPLISAFNDSVGDIRWVACEGVADHGNRAIEPVLRELIKGARSVPVRRCVFHVLRRVSARRDVLMNLAPVLAALEGPEPSTAGAVAAEQALMTMPERPAHWYRAMPTGVTEALGKDSKVGSATEPRKTNW